MQRFQSTLPRRERQSWKIKRQVANYFNPRSHEGSDFRFQTNDQGRLHFNPRSHEGSDKAAHISIVCGQLFQSTLPRRERRETSLHLMHICAISIHAPTKGATVSPSIISSSLYDYNPRSHEGSDSFGISLSRQPFHISIHAPTKGATIPSI